MILVLIFGGGLGFIIHRARVQRDAVAAIKKVGGNVLYDWQWKRGLPLPSGKPRWPQWLVDRMGADYFGNVVFVFLPERGSDEEMAQIGHLSRVEALLVRSPSVTDAGLEHLTHLTHLKKVMFANCPISDSGMPILEQLPELRVLSVYHTKVSAARIKTLQRTLPNARIEF